MNLSRKIFIYSIIGTSVFVYSSCGRGGGKKDAGAASARIYPVQEVKKGDAVLESVYPVTLRGEDDADIKPRVSGYIDHVYVNEGDIVKKGQRLFSINSPSSEQDFTTAEAALESAKAQLSTAKLDVERIRVLAEKDIVSKVQLQSYENAYKTSEANKLKAEAALTAARATVGWTIVPSPIDGVVGAIPYRNGNMVTSATSLTTISNTKTIYAYFSLNEKTLAELLNAVPGHSQAEKIANIDDVTLLLPDKTAYSEKGKISAISGVINTITGAVTLRAEFPNPQGALKSGASGNISVPRKVADVIVIPQKATFSLQDKTIIYKAQKTDKPDMDSTVQAMITVLPLPDGQNYAVTSGLTDGDRFVTDGVATLRNGSLIKTR
ncbi:MAG: efflux RND transporter periplasmic adaptor subunit [Dysgonamonadaceae bacterium]|jgi:membrane fusion protein (multidrug efflux system)|nr:efflux RND transporter periplasmic adaptor subunit [Dysgonamonadaceae bacterium]